jgi:hypothetical protein
METTFSSILPLQKFSKLYLIDSRSIGGTEKHLKAFKNSLQRHHQHHQNRKRRGLSTLDDHRRMTPGSSVISLLGESVDCSHVYPIL